LKNNRYIYIPLIYQWYIEVVQMQNAKNLLKTAKEYLSKKDVKLKQKYFWEISNFVKKLLEGIDQVTIDNYWLKPQGTQLKIVSAIANPQNNTVMVRVKPNKFMEKAEFNELRGKLSQKGFKYIGNGVFEYKVVVKDVESS